MDLALHAREHDGPQDAALMAASIPVGIAAWEGGSYAVVQSVKMAAGARVAGWVSSRGVPILGQILLCADIAARLVSLGTGYRDWTLGDVWNHYAGTLDAPGHLAGPPPAADHDRYCD